MNEGLLVMAAPALPSKARTLSADLRIELRARSDEERTYVVKSREGFLRVIKCLEGGLVREAHSFAASGLMAADRRMRQLGGDPDGTAA